MTKEYNYIQQSVYYQEMTVNSVYYKILKTLNTYLLQLMLTSSGITRLLSIPCFG